MWLLVGLGNPGPQYSLHKHNVGFMVIDVLRSRSDRSKESLTMGGSVALGVHGEKQWVTLKPMEFMNVSGRAVSRIAQFYKIPLQQTIVVHDELDLSFGQMKVKQGGGDGGHNGLRSISSLVGNDYIRVRVGIGRPSHGSKEQVSNYVLSPFDKAQHKQLPLLLGYAVDAIFAVMDKGLTFAMNQYNRILFPE